MNVSDANTAKQKPSWQKLVPAWMLLTLGLLAVSQAVRWNQQIAKVLRMHEQEGDRQKIERFTELIERKTEIQRHIEAIKQQRQSDEVILASLRAHLAETNDRNGN